MVSLKIMHTFTTKYLFIRPISAQDQTLYSDLYTNKEIMRYIDTPLTLSDAKIGFDRTLKLMQMKKPYFLTWVVIDNVTNKSIGLQTLIINTPKNTAAKSALSGVIPPEVGIVLTLAAQGKSHSTAALSALMEYGFRQLKLSHINIRFCHKNLAIKHVAKKLGFKFSPSNDTSNICGIYKQQNWQQKIITKIL